MRGGSRLDLGGEEHAFRSLLPGGRAHVAAASPPRRPRALVLRLEGALAVEPHVYLSSLENRPRPVVAVHLPVGNGRAGGCSRSAGTEKPRTAGRPFHFCRHALSGA